MARNSNRLAAVATVAALVGGGAGAGAVVLTRGSSHGTSVPAAAAGGVNVASTTLSVGQIAKAVTPSVVEVAAAQTTTGSPFPGGQNGATAQGTGFVFDSKGNVVTNEHVVSGSTSVSVKLSDGSTHKATVVGTDPSTDLAVLHIDASSSKLAPLSLADSSKVAVGDGVVAIGNPFGLDGTVTTGIVSALNREIVAPDNTPIEDAIQTDAAINHGNSGGPLLDLRGSVIGITSQIESDSGGNDGVGFAVPSNTVRSIAAQLISTGKAQHALLGVSVKTVSSGVGVSVSQVRGGSAADAAGLRAGDVITAIDGTPVATAEKLRAIIAGHRPGDSVTLTVQRNGSAKILKAALGTKA